MNEDGNASLIEISVAAIILLGSIGLASTMQPEVHALTPATSEFGYVQSIMDAFIAEGNDPEALVESVWADGEASGDTWFDQVDDDYSLYLNNGVDRILIYGDEREGARGTAYYTSLATFGDGFGGLLFNPEAVYAPGQNSYTSQGLGYVVDGLGPSESVRSIEHYAAGDTLVAPLASTSAFQNGPNGQDWLDIWNDALDERVVPTQIPYGAWVATVEEPILPPLIYNVRTVEWYVLHEPNADTNIPHYPTYALELVL